MSFPSYVELGFGEEKATSSTRIGNLSLGTHGITPDGNVWRYCQASATGIAAGLFCVGESVPVHEDTVTVAHAVGTETVTVTASGVSADDYKDGYLVVTDGTGAGETHRIKSNTATSGGVITITFYEGDGLIVAWSTSDTDVDIFTPLFGGLVIAPVDGQQLAVVLTQGIITASYFFWGLAKGYGAFDCDNAAAAAGLELDEKNIVQSLNHAGKGYIDGSPDATAVLAGYRQNLGFLLTEEDTTDNNMEFAKIDLL
jgi:hypothetical protein